MADVVALDGLDEDDLVGRIEDADAIMLYHNIGADAEDDRAARATAS